MINFNELDRTTYETLRQTFIELLEAKRVAVYDDGIGIPTIGIGYNLRDIDVADSVITSMGVNPDDDIFDGNPAASAIESDYANQLRTACANNALNVQQLTDALSRIMTSRYSDTGLDAIYGTGANNERKQIFTYTGVNDPAMLRPFRLGVERYEDRVDGWAGGAGIIPDSYERLAFLSMAYRGDVNAGVAPSMRRAFDQGNRAELWYEIRYNTVGGRTSVNIQRGVAKRKYIESEMIGLFPSALLIESNVINALKMYSKHRVHILDYDADERKGESARNLANEDEDFSPFLLGGSVSDIHGELNPAINWVKVNGYDELQGDLLNLIQHLDGEFIIGDHTSGVVDDALGSLSDAQHPVNKSDLIMGLSGNDYILSQQGNDVVFGGLGEDEIYAGEGNDRILGGEGNDKLDGEDGHDFLYGGKGDDRLTGGKGVDRLEGGDGKDTYIFDGDFGRDIIVDRDEDGTIIINGATLSKFELVEGTDIIYRDDKNNPTFEAIKINEGTTTSLLITPLGVAIGAGTVVIKNWSEGGLGIHLDEPDEEEPDMTGIWTINGNGNDNAISANNFLEDNPTKSLDDYKGLSVNAGAGHDVIMGLLQGNDTLLGGDGDDVISGGFSTSLGETSFMLPQLPTGTGIDSIDGGKGDDYISVSANGSLAHGGDDNDILTALSGLYIEALTVAELKGGSAEIDLNEHAEITRDQVWSDIRSMLDFSVSGIVVGTTHVYTPNSGKFIGLTPSFVEFTGVSSGATFIAKESSAGYRLTYDYSTHDGLVEHGYSPALYRVSTSFTLAAGRNYEEIANVKGSNLYGDVGDDYLFGGLFSDFLSGGEDHDTLFAGEGNDILDGGAGEDFLNGQEGNDIILGGDGNDTLIGSDSSLRINAQDNDTLFGGDGDDELNGGAGDDYLEGGSGRDKFHGGKGNDTIVASLDDYYVQDEEGDDVIIINNIVAPVAPFAKQNFSGAMNKEAFSTSAAEAAPLFTVSDNVGSNTLALVGASDFSSIGLTSVGNDLILNNSGDKIYVANGLNGSISNFSVGESLEDFTGNSSSVKKVDINSLLLSNLSTAVTRTALVADTDLVGGLNSDRLTAHAAGSTLIGGKGNDTLLGEIGDDVYVLRRGDGQDTLTEKGGNNKIKLAEGITPDQVSLRRSGANLILMIATGESITVSGMFNASTGVVIANKAIQSVEFSDGQVWDSAQIQLGLTKGITLFGTDLPDTLSGFENNDTLNGGAGSDILNGRVGDDSLLGGEGKDTLRGELGQDILDGGDGDDSVEGGDGHDKLIGGGGSDSLYGELGNDTLDGGSGNDRLFGQAGNDTYLFGKGDGLDEIAFWSSNLGVEDILIFKEGVVPSDIKLMKSGYGRNLKLIIVSTGESITVKDYFYAAENTILKKVTFTDTTEWDSSFIAANVVFSTSGNDVLLGDLGADDLSGSDGDDILTGGEGNDTLSGENGIDTLIGGRGNDNLSGNESVDTYVFNVGDGKDLIYEYLDKNYSNAIVFGEGITQDDIRLGRNKNDLVLFIGQLGDQITIESYYQNLSSIFNDRNFDLSFVDGVIALRDFHGQAVIDTFFTTETGEQVSGTPGNDLISLLGGNDTVGGGGGDDTLIGGLGNDRLYGGDGQDNFVFNVGDGQDTIENGGQSLTEYDQIIMGDGIVRDNIIFARRREDLILFTGESGDQITIAQYFRGDIERRKAYEVHFSHTDELIKLEALLGNSNTTVLPPTEDADNLYGFDGGDLIRGLGGSDSIYGEGGNDTIIGGAGDDRLFGGHGFNTYAFHRGDGKDFVNAFINYSNESSPYDEAAISLGGRIIFDENISREDISLRISNGNIVIKYGTNDEVDIAVPMLAKNSYSVTREAELNAVANWEVQIGGEVTSLGNLVDNAPNIATSIYIFRYAGNDYYLGTSWNDIINIEAATDGGDVEGALGNDVLVGSRFKDYLYGELGNDTLSGGLGNDWLTGGDGDDTYKYVYGSGNDEIFEASGIDKVAFGVGILPHEVVVSRTGLDGKGSDLVFTFTNGESLKIKYVFDTNTGAINLNNAIEEFQFSNSSSWTFWQAINLIAGGDLIAPLPPSASIDSSGLIVRGFAEAGSLVEIKNELGVVLGNTSAEIATGSYTVTLSTALVNNERIKITAKDTAGNVSPVTVINAPDYTAPPPPSGKFFLYPGEYINGITEVDTFVEARSSSGELLGRSDVISYGSAGSYSITLAIKLTNGEVVNLTAIDAAGNVSLAQVIVAPDIVAPAQPSAAFDLTGKVITGVAEAGSTVIVKSSSGVELKNTIADALTGAYSITLTTALVNKETVNVTAKDTAGNVSAIKAIVAPDKTPPGLPTASFDTVGKVISGVAEAGSVVVVKNASNTGTLGTITAHATTGAYSITLATALINKESVNVTATDSVGNISAIKTAIAPDKTAPIAPTANFDAAGKVINGVAEAGSVVIVKTANNTSTLGTVTAHATTGAYSITLATALINKETVNITATDAAGNVSVARALVAPDVATPNPTAIIIQAESYTSMSGVRNENTSDVGGGQNAGYIEAGDWMAYNNAAISVPTAGVYKVTYRVASLNGGGRLTLKELSSDSALGVVTIPKTGGWQTWVDVTQEITLSGGEHNFKLAADIGGFNINWFKLEPVAATAPITPDTTPPVQPTAAFDPQGKVISGIAEAGSVVVVKNANNTSTLGTVTADATTGAYSITLVTALINKETVTATDAVGNISVLHAIIAPDKTAPAAPTVNVDIASKRINGVAEAGSSVTVKDSEGQTLGVVQANAATGAYSVSFTQTLINGQSLFTTATDTAGNVSSATATPIIIDTNPLPAGNGLRGSYYGYHQSTNGNVNLTNVAQVRALISNKAPDAAFIGKVFQYGVAGANELGMGTTLQTFLKTDAAYLNVDPANTSDAILKFDGKIQLDAGSYSFRVRADDGYSILVNGAVVAEYNANQAATTRTHGAFTIAQSGLQDIEIVYWDAGGGAFLNVELANTATGNYAYLDQSILFQPSATVPVAIVAENNRPKTDYEGVHYYSSNDALIQAMASFVSGSGVDTRYRSTHAEQSPLMIAVGS